MIDELEQDGYLLRSGAREVTILPKGNEATSSLRILLDKVYEAYKTSLSLPKEGVEELALITLSLGLTSLLNALTVWPPFNKTEDLQNQEDPSPAKRGFLVPKRC